MEEKNLTYLDLLPSTNIQFNFDWLNYYFCSAANIQSLVTYINSSDYNSNISKLFNNPVENIVGVVKFPLPENSVTTRYADDIYISNVNTGVKATNVANITSFPQLIEIGRFYPHQTGLFNLPQDLTVCSCKLWLPYCNMINLDISELLRYNVIYIYYTLNYNDGTCVANVIGSVNDNNTEYNILYQVNGKCGQEVEYGGRDQSVATNSLTSMLTNSLAVSGAVVTGDVGIKTFQSLGNIAISALQYQNSDKAKKYGGSQNNGFFNPDYPYLLLTRRTVQDYYNNGYGGELGYACNEYKTLSSLSGYTVVNDVHLQGFSTATSSEIDEIDNLLKSGVIL